MDLSGRKTRLDRRPGLKRRGWTLIGIVLGLVVFVGALSLLWRIGPEPLRPGAAGEVPVQVYLVDNGFHTDWVLPRETLLAGEGTLSRIVTGQGADNRIYGDWIYVGWGDARFFVEQGPIMARWRDGLRALLARGNASVLMVRAGSSPLSLYGEQERVAITLSPAAYERLVRHIEAGMVTAADGAAVLATRRMSDGTRFYAHRDHFWIGNLCNHWSLQGLKAAGMSIWPLRPMTSGEVIRQARLGVRRDPSAGVDLAVQAH